MKRRKNRKGIALYGLLFIAFVVCFAPFIANDQPLYVNFKGEGIYPAWRSTWIAKTFFGYEDIVTITVDGQPTTFQPSQIDWRKTEVENIIWPLIPYSSQQQDYYNRDYVSPCDNSTLPLPNGTSTTAPLKFKHLLGTDALGRDTLSGIIYGLRYSLWIGILSTLIAAIIGITLGLISGYHGDKGYRISYVNYVMFIPVMVYAWFIAFVVRNEIILQGFEVSMLKGIIQFIFSLLIFIGGPAFIFMFIERIPFPPFNRKTNFPIDSALSRLNEILGSLPRIFVVLCIAAIVQSDSTLVLVLILGLSGWSSIYKITRAETLRIKSMGYIEAAEANGLSPQHIFIKHILPNLKSALIAVLLFTLSGIILLESGLSFLGIGVPADTITLGGLIANGKNESDAWWLIVFPGLALFITIMIFNLLGNRLGTSPNEARG